MKGFRKIWDEIRHGENVDVYITLVVSVAVAIGGFLSGGLQEKIFSAMLMVLGIISIGLLINRRINEKVKEILEHRQLDFNTSSIKEVVAESNENLIRALNGVSVAIYPTAHEYAQYKAKRLRRAKKVDDVTWRSHGYDVQTRSQSELQALQNVDEITREIIKKEGVIWREVAVFRTKAHLEQELLLIQNPENIGYNFGFYPVPPTSQNPPRIGFMIIDNEELFIGYVGADRAWLIP